MSSAAAGPTTQAAFTELAVAEGAAAILRISGRGDGVIDGGTAGSRTAGDPEGLPHVALSREQYNQIYRNVPNGVPVEIEMMVENRFYEDDLQQYNSLGEIPGSDKSDEFIMLGAHLDSCSIHGTWQAARPTTQRGRSS